jgi:O-antigen/teichoic acid export membrane protein
MPNEENISTHGAARGMLQLAGKEIVSSLSAIVFFIVIARLLPDINDFGILVGLQTIILMFVLTSTLGFPYAGIRFISMYYGSSQQSRANKLYPLLFILGIILSAIFSATLFVFSPYISHIFFRDASVIPLLQLSAIDVFFLALGTFCSCLLDASMEFRRIARISIFITLLKYSLSFAFFMSGLGLGGIILGLVVADGIGVVAFAFASSTMIFGTKLNLTSFLAELRPLVKYSLSIYGYIISNFLFSRIDVYLLMLLSTLYIVGLYGPAVFVGVTFFILLLSLDQALVPFTSRIYGKNGTATFKDVASRASRFLFLFYLPLGFVIAASSPTLVTLIMGQRFAESVYPLIIIVVAITLASPGILVNTLLRSAGYTGVALKASAAAVIVQILVSLIMIPHFGMIGASSARFVAYFVLIIPLIYKLKRIGGFDFDRRALKYGLMGSAIIVSEIVVISTIVVGPLSLLVQYSVSLLTYLFILRASHALNQKDAQLIEKILMGKLNWLTGSLARFLIRES